MIFRTTPAWANAFANVAHCARNTVLPDSVPSDCVSHVRAICRRVRAVLSGRICAASPDSSRHCWTVQELAQYIGAAIRAYEEHGDFSVPDETATYLLLKDALRDLRSAIPLNTPETP